MTILPALTSTRKERISAFVRDLRASAVREIALFPTVLDRNERTELYRDLESIPGLAIPHVHLRADCRAAEIRYLRRRFGSQVFNIHPRRSTHPFGPVPTPFARSVFIENVQVAPEDGELSLLGGVCPDYAHLESARRMEWDDYVSTVERQVRTFPVGCCHVSAIRDGDPNEWNGGPDHHSFEQLADFDYMTRYTDMLPDRWVSLELENTLAEQLEAVDYVTAIVEARADANSSIA